MQRQRESESPLKFPRGPRFVPPQKQVPYLEEIEDGDEYATDEYASGEIEIGEYESDDDFEEAAEPQFQFTEGDLRFLRDFILSSALYVEQLESLVCESSDEFWQSREHAYRIVTSMLIKYFLYEMEEEPDPNYEFGD